MKKAGLIASLIGVLLLTLVVLPLGCTSEATPNLKVVTTTSLIASIVEKVGGDKVQVANIIPPAQLFLTHGWQGEMFSTDLIESADNPELKVVSLNIPGNWMTPTVQAQAVGNITSTLAEIDPQNASYYQNNARSQQAAITAKGNELKARLEAGNLSQFNVICSEQITGLVQWTGFNVIASYGRPEDLSIKDLQDLIEKAKEASVALVIDNLQSGFNAGEAMVQDIGAIQVTLSNFPGGFDDTETWEKAVEKDVDLMLEALASYQSNKP
jgi:zinc transport system substrate-binding protein